MIRTLARAGALALAIALTTAPVLAQSPPQIRWTGNQLWTPYPFYLIGFDSVSGQPCIVGLTATCLLPVSGGGGGGGGGAVTIASGGVVSGAYVLGAIADLGASGQLHQDLTALNTTAGNPTKLQDSGNGDPSDPVNHAFFTEPTTNGRFVQAPVSITTTSATTLVAAQASLYTYITDLDCENSGQYSFTLAITNSASTALYTLLVPPGGGWVKSFTTPLGGNGQMAVGTAISVTATQVGGTGQTPNITCNVQGRVRNN